MTLASFFTLTVPTPGQAKPSGYQALSGAAGLTGPQGLSFLDFILTQLGQDTAANGKTPEPKQALESKNPLLSKNPKLDLVNLLSDNPAITEEVKNFSADEQAQIAQTLALNQQAFDEILRPLIGANGTLTAEDLEKLGALESATGGQIRFLDVFPGAGEVATSGTLHKLAAILNQIEKFAAKDNTPLVITTNLTPDQITALKDAVAAIQNGKPSGEEPDLSFLDNIFVGLVEIVPPAASTAQPGHALILAQTQAQASAAESDTALAARLNAINTGGAAPVASNTNPDLTGGFKQHGYEGNPEQAAKNNTPVQDGNPKIAPDKTALVTAAFAAGSIIAGFDTGNTGMTFDIDSYFQQQGISAQGLTQASQAAGVNIAAQNTSAALPHPATQMIAATLQKYAGGGEDKTLRLQLDPPELGRIEIRLSFEKDKSVKALMIAEKPETMAMLQRDAHALERALTAAGLDADGGLSFELAQEGYDFNHNGRHDGGGQGSSGAETAADEEFIETTMTWHVDPETGHMRYDLLV